MFSWRKVSIAVAIVAAMLTTGLTYVYLERLGGSIQVLVAASDLEGSIRLTPGDLRWEEMPATAVHPQALTDPSLAVGRYLLVPLVKGQMLLEPHLAPPGAGGPVASRLMPGYTAFFVPLTIERGLGGAVEEGDRVDFLLIGRGTRSDGPIIQNVVRGVKVLEIRDEMGRPITAGSAGSTVPAGLLVEVTPEDAIRLAFGLEQGTVYATISAAATTDGREAP